jgi:hypothetical protein
MSYADIVRTGHADREGNPTGEYTYQGGVANKALELLGKVLGIFQPTQETTEVNRNWRRGGTRRGDG